RPGTPSSSWPCLLPTSPLLPPSFFFSSRRRHTSWPRDWSSDVCSSDLCLRPFARGGRRHHLVRPRVRKAEGIGWQQVHVAIDARSEERRVGKECRSRSST